jgi:hypothetical protein
MSSEHDGDRDGLRQVRDPEEFVQQRRLEDIFEARDRLRDRRLLVRQAQKRDRWAAVSSYRGAVGNYVSELEPLMDKYDDGRYYLNEYTFGQVVVHLESEEARYPQGPDRILVKTPTDPDRDAIHVTEEPDPVTYEIEGLRALFKIPDPITHTFELKTTRRGRDGTIEHTTKAQITFDILDRMQRAASLFLSDIGLELDPDDDDDEWEV